MNLSRHERACKFEIYDSKNGNFGFIIPESTFCNIQDVFLVKEK